MIKGCNIFWVKIGKYLQFCGLEHYRATRKILESRMQLDESIECVLGGDLLPLYEFQHFLVFPMVRVFCALRLESRKKYQHGLDVGPLEFQFLRPRGCLTNPFRTLSLCFGVTGKTPGLISRNNFVKKF